MYWEVRYVDHCDFLNYVYFKADIFSDYIGKYNCNPIPEHLRLVVQDQDLVYVKGERINFFQYIYRKYIKKVFPFGYRLNWEKEKIY